MDKQGKIEKILQGMNDNETNRKMLINIFDYVAYNSGNTGMIDYTIEGMDYINEIACGMKPMDILNEFSRVNINDDYLYFNGNHYKSGDAYEAIKENILERCFDEDIAEYIIEHDEDFDVDEIRDILESEN